MRIIWVDDLNTGKLNLGETDNKPIEMFYIRIFDITTGDYRIIYKACVFLDTPENVRLIMDHQKRYRVWKTLEPDIFSLLNKLEK